MENPNSFVILISSLNAGGAQKTLQELCESEGLKSKKIRLIVTSLKSSRTFFEFGENVEIVYMQDIISPSTGWLVFLYKLLKVRALILEANPKIVISFLTNTNVLTLISCTFTGIKVVVCERTFPAKSKAHFILLLGRYLLYRYSSCVIVQTERGRIWLENNIPGVTTAVIPNSVSFPLPQPTEQEIQSPIRDHGVFIFALGRMIADKGFSDIIHCLSDILQSGKEVSLVIGGDGPVRHALQKLAFDLGCQNNVFFPGEIEYPSVWFQQQPIFVLSSYREGYPNVLLEAMSYGCPSVAYNCETGPAEIIEDQINGILVEVGNKANLSQAIKSLLGNKDLQEKISVEAVKVRETHSPEKIVDMWREVIDAD